MASEWQVVEGDSLEVLRRLPAECVDSVVTDPPAGIGFMGKEWDSDKGGRGGWVSWMTTVMLGALRAMKPGAHGLVWALPRTSHWTATALEDAGFEIRDVITHHFGSGFPKSLDVSKAIDKAAGAERADGAREWTGGARTRAAGGIVGEGLGTSTRTIFDTPATDSAKQWAGWGTALKPGSEHWILVRKPLTGTVAANVQEHGTGAINIDACRIGYGDKTLAEVHAEAGSPGRAVGKHVTAYSPAAGTDGPISFHAQGRWPANVILSHSAACEEGSCADDCPVRAMDAQSGTLTSGAWNGQRQRPKTLHTFGEFEVSPEAPREGSSGGASRFFYCAKPSTREKEAGIVGGKGDGGEARGNTHPTVKSIALMTYLVRLISPPGGLVLDPFAGSGTTGIACVQGGWNFLGIEKSPEFVKIAEARIGHWAAFPHEKVSAGKKAA